MNRSILVPLLFVANVALAGEPSTSNDKGTTTTASTTDNIDFDKLDTNRDGMVDRIEARAGEKANAMFDQVDKDKNGSISRAEHDVWKKENRYMNTEDAKSLFVTLDTNKDRQIDKTEASAAADVLPKFSFADDDSNGKLSETEWMRWRQETSERGEETSKEMQKADTNGTKAGDKND